MIKWVLLEFVDTICVMWGRTYARQRRARDVRRAAARAEAAGPGDQEEGAAKESG